jgi:hypothetical protein
MLEAITAQTLARSIVLTVAKKDATEQTFFQQLNKIKASVNRTYVSKLKKDLKDQQADVVSKLAAYAASVKAGGDVIKAYEEIMPSETAEADKSAEWLVPLMILALSQGASTALALLDIDDDPNISTAAKNAAETAAKRVVREFTTQTVEKLKAEIVAGVNAGEDLKALTARVNKVYSDAYGWRATRLSDSESHKSINKGVQIAFEQGGVKHKIWKTLGANPCQFCRAMDGTIIETKKPFVPKGSSIQGEDGGELVQDYEEVENAHAHANCNCWLFPAD